MIKRIKRYFELKRKLKFHMVEAIGLICLALSENTSNRNSYRNSLYWQGKELGKIVRELYKTGETL